MKSFLSVLGSALTDAQFYQEIKRFVSFDQDRRPPEPTRSQQRDLQRFLERKHGVSLNRFSIFMVNYLYRSIEDEPLIENFAEITQMAWEGVGGKKPNLPVDVELSAAVGLLAVDQVFREDAFGCSSPSLDEFQLLSRFLKGDYVAYRPVLSLDDEDVKSLNAFLRSFDVKDALAGVDDAWIQPGGKCSEGYTFDTTSISSSGIRLQKNSDAVGASSAIQTEGGYWAWWATPLLFQKLEQLVNLVAGSKPENQKDRDDLLKALEHLLTIDWSGDKRGELKPEIASILRSLFSDKGTQGILQLP